MAVRHPQEVLVLQVPPRHPKVPMVLALSRPQTLPQSWLNPLNTFPDHSSTNSLVKLPR